MARRRSIVTIPPSLAGHVSTSVLQGLEENQRNAVLELLERGEISPKEATDEIKLLAQGTFGCKYLGSVPVAAAKLTSVMWRMFGEQVITTAGPRIKMLKQKPVDVTLSFSGNGIRIIGDESVLLSDAFEDVVFSGVDSTDKKKFAYLTQHTRLGLIFCHCFSVKAKAEVIITTINALRDSIPRIDESDADKHEQTTGQTIGIFELGFLGTVALKHFRESVAITSAERESLNQRLSQAVRFAVMELKIDTKAENSKSAVVLVVSSEGIRIVEQASREILDMIFLQDIVYTTEIEGKKSQIFALIAKNEHLNRRSCYVFGCKHHEAAEICAKLEDAEQAFQEDEKLRQGNPFIASSSLKETPHPLVEAFEIPRNSLVAKIAVGAGQFGQVYLAEHKGQMVNGKGAAVAVKILRGGASVADKALFVREGAILAHIRHVNVIGLVGVCTTTRPWLMVLMYCLYGDLNGVLRACEGHGVQLSYTEQLSWALQVATALAFVAAKGYVHMDVAARNVLLHSKNRLKLADFGLARKYDLGKQHYVMRQATQLSIRWLCPEIMGPPPKIAGEASDVWSYGVLLWEILTYCRRRPYARLDLRDVQKYVRTGGRLIPPKECPPEFHEIMLDSWRVAPDERPKFSHLCKALSTHLSSSGQTPPRDIGNLLFQLKTQRRDSKQGLERQTDSLNVKSVGPSLTLQKTKWEDNDELVAALSN
eukprot:m.95908 g.95908  ORF g.95908 m.95908 type:complete len:708 (+) comp13521_c0_seq1:241-2364(+)